jgi:hypothetical protein
MWNIIEKLIWYEGGFTLTHTGRRGCAIIWWIGLIIFIGRLVVEKIQENNAAAQVERDRAFGKK